MKLTINKWHGLLPGTIFMFCFLFGFQVTTVAQDSTEAAAAPAPSKVKPVKNTFESLWIIDNQTVMVPQKGTFEMEIMHRFGPVDNGYDDFWGLFAPSNIRLGASYSPIDDLMIGVGITKSNMLWDVSAKYAILKQTNGQYPVSITYYGNLGWDTRKDEDGSIFKYGSQRLVFFNQLIFARKINDKLSIQVSPSVSHQNSVNGFYTKNDSTGTTTYKEMEFNHFAISFAARYKLTDVTSIIVNYDQPLTKHNQNNPNPNLAFGFEFSTSSHSFQLFAGNYYFLSPQRNNLYNDSNPFGKYTDANGKEHKGGQFRIGFNITRLWNY